MIKCRVCAAENEPEAAYCGVCGSKLDADEVDTTAVEPGPEPKPIPPPPPEPKPEPKPAPDPQPDPKPTSPPPPAPQPQPKPLPPQPSGITCLVCGTLNELSRSFCKKCASELRPTAPVRKPLVSRAFLVRFLVSALVGVAVVVAGAEILSRLPLGGSADASPIPISLVSDTGAETAFGLQPADPQPLAALPDTATLQLTSYEEPGASEAPGETAAQSRPRWWNDAVPRIPAVSQFDGGPLQGVNCVMASGAMLARLGYGVVTTGSQLRALSGDPDGPTSFLDLQKAVYRGWGIRFSMGAASPLQLRALMYAGAGAEIVVVYGQIPVGIRLQASFTGNHAIYLDAFSPTGLNGQPAYYVMDPIGHTWQGYKGEWWPADVVERAATAFGNGRIATTWTFAGGKVPFVHPVLPRSAYPSDTPAVTPAPGETAAPGQTFGPGGLDPLPTGDLPLDIDTTNGDPPPDQPKFPRYDFLKDAYLMTAGEDGARCTTKPIPPDCPLGIVGVIGTIGVLSTPPPVDFKLLYANAISFGTYQIIFQSPLEGDRSLLFWDSSGTTYEKATVESGLLSGQEVSIATITLDPAKDYSFVATATEGDVNAVSSVGTLTVK